MDTNNQQEKQTQVNKSAIANADSALNTIKEEQKAAPVATSSASTVHPTQTVNPVQLTNTVYRVPIQCAIRRKLSLIGLPGADPNERIYKLGSSLDIKTGKNLKAIEGELEKKYMPSIIGINSSDNHFQKEVNEYWGNIGVLIPADETHLREDEKGKVIRFTILVTGAALKELIEQEGDIEKKMNIINNNILKDLVSLERESDISDYLLLNFALKNKEVAKDVSLANNSPKIKYYLFNKNIAVKQRMNIIELKAKAMDMFTTVQQNDDKVNALLVMFGLLPTDFDTAMDRVIALDAEYSKSPETMQKFVDYAKDEDLELKYLIKLATKKGKITNPSNTDAYYYNQILLGKTINEAVLYLKDDNAENKNIKSALEREIKE